MTQYRAMARVVGILFFASYIGVAIGAALMAPALDPETGLAAIHADKPRYILGVLFEFINDAAVIGIAVLLYPFLKRAGEGLALWYVGIRILEGGMFMIASASVLALVDLGDRFVSVGSSIETGFENARAAALGQYFGASMMATVAFVSGAILLYILLYRSQIVPRFIAIWGFLAVTGVIVVNVLAPDITEASGPVLLLVIPMIANELFLAVWFIVKGLRLSEDVSVEGGAR